MEQLLFKLDAFEGPLDLLLTLIRKNKMKITDISVSVILDQYLAAIADMQSMDIEVSSEFLLLAAQLLYIKSRELLPKRGEDEEEDEDASREALIARLLEYQNYKEAAGFLAEREHAGSASFYKTPDYIAVAAIPPDLSKLTTDTLLRAYRLALYRGERKQPPPIVSFSGIVGVEKVSIRDMAHSVWGRLKEKSKMLFGDIFRGSKSKPEAVATFLALLELIKFKKIRVEYDRSKAPVICRIGDVLDVSGIGDDEALSVSDA